MLAERELAFAQDALTERQKLYVRARAQGSPPAAAARFAGLPDYRPLEEAKGIRKAIAIAARVERYHQQIHREDVVSGFLDAVHMAANSSELTGAWREIGRILGHYEPTRVDVTVTKREEIQKLSDAELINLAAEDYEALDFEEPADK